MAFVNDGRLLGGCAHLRAHQPRDLLGGSAPRVQRVVQQVEGGGLRARLVAVAAVPGSGGAEQREEGDASILIHETNFTVDFQLRPSTSGL